METLKKLQRFFHFSLTPMKWVSSGGSETLGDTDPGNCFTVIEPALLSADVPAVFTVSQEHVVFILIQLQDLIFPDETVTGIDHGHAVKFRMVRVLRKQIFISAQQVADHQHRIPEAPVQIRGQFPEPFFHQIIRIRVL